MNFLQKAFMKKMIVGHAKEMPEEMREMLGRLVDENPDLLMAIGNDIAVAMKSGKDQMGAAREVMEKHKTALEHFMQKG